MQIKTTMRYHLTPIRMAIIISQHTTRSSEDVRKENPFALLVGMEICAATVENSMEIPQIIKNELPMTQ